MIWMITGFFLSKRKLGAAKNNDVNLKIIVHPFQDAMISLGIDFALFFDVLINELCHHVLQRLIS